MRLLLPFQLLAPCRRERTLAGGRAPGGAGAHRGGGVRMNRAVAVWLALLAIPARQLAPQQRDTVPDSVFLRVASTRWPEPREAFGEWRAFQSGRLHAQAPRCRNVAPALTRDSVGPVRPGMTLSELLRVCPHTLRLWSYYAPRDRWSPVVAVALGSAILTRYLEDTLPLSKIGSLALSDTGIRGPGGLGAGSTYGEFKARYGQGTLNGGAEECTTVEVTFPALPGEFFDLDYRSQCEILRKQRSWMPESFGSTSSPLPPPRLLRVPARGLPWYRTAHSSLRRPSRGLAPPPRMWQQRFPGKQPRFPVVLHRRPLSRAIHSARW